MVKIEGAIFSCKIFAPLNMRQKVDNLKLIDDKLDVLMPGRSAEYFTTSTSTLIIFELDYSLDLDLDVLMIVWFLKM